MSNASIDAEKFFRLFLDELRIHQEMQPYYKFLSNDNRFFFRKNYFQRRLNFIRSKINSREEAIWDVGCGYGTTAIYLALNGFKVHGSTLESYHEITQRRIAYWSRYGDLGNLTLAYEDIFTKPLLPFTPSTIIVQDTLHHLEPIGEALQLFHDILASKGKILVIEENGENLIQKVILYLRRGSKRVITIHDHTLNKDITIGNENTRSMKAWEDLFRTAGFLVGDIEYLRCLPPFMWNESNSDKLQKLERELWRRNNVLRKYFYFGMNFLAAKI